MEQESKKLEPVSPMANGTEVETLVLELVAAGIVFATNGERLVMKNLKACPVSDEVLGLLRQNKHTVSCFLRGPVYAEMARAALSRMHHQHVDGVIRWIEQERPDLYQHLMVVLFEKINEMWNAQAPVEQFQKMLEEFAQAHAKACAEYRAWQSKNPKNADTRPSKKASRNKPVESQPDSAGGHSPESPTASEARVAAGEERRKDLAQGI
jgi:hypothetical protein